MSSPTAFGTVRALIDRAYVNCGLIAAGVQCNSQQYADAFNRLNERINFLQTKGLKLWTNVDTTLTLIAGTDLYDLGPAALVGISMVKPLRIPFAYYLDASGSKVPMTPMSRQELTVLQTQTSSGIPLKFYDDKQQTKLQVTIWPTPDTNAVQGSVHLILQTQIPNGSALTDTVAFPSEWFNGLAWDLADELATGQPAAIVARCAMKAREFIADLENWDVEGAQTYFTLDQRMTYGSSDFA